MSDRLRTVVREQRFEDEAAAIEPNVKRMDEALEYVEGKVSEHPDSGIQSSVPGIWVAPVRFQDADGKAVRGSIFYIFDNDYVRWRSIRLAP